MKTNIQLAITAQLDAAAPYSGGVQHAVKFAKNIPDGSGAGQADEVMKAEYTIAASGTQDIDLNGALTDALGASLVMSTIVGWAIVHDADSSASGIKWAPKSSGGNSTVFSGTSPEKHVGGAGAWDAAYNPSGFGNSPGSDAFTITNEDGSNAANVTVLFFGRSV